MPAYFIGHGSPMNAIETNPYTERLSKIVAELPQKPTSILMISAHWLTRGTMISTAKMPETIHDFGGFPQALFDVQYPAPGAVDLAANVLKLAPEVHADPNYGLDHGAWAVLRHVFPGADVPVAQMSIDYYESPRYHFELGKKLAGLREQGVLVLASGNIVHNLRMYMTSQGKQLPWAQQFNDFIKERLLARDFEAILEYKSQGEAATLSVPSIDHFAPLFCILGMSRKDEQPEIIYEEVDGAMSMLSFRVG
jgi:4,5-DOPA dioxygenase extradiol